MPKPNELFVGILEFFAVLLPGAALTAILLPFLSQFVLGTLVPTPISDVASGASFLAASYFFGHFAFFAGSYIDPLYDKLRKKRNPYVNASAYDSATLVRNEILAEHEQNSLNTLQWSRSVLLALCPAAADDVHRMEADSKFFRSVLIVCAVAAVVFTFKGRNIEALASLALMFPCFARYYERRLKSTTQAYIHIITLHRLGKLAESHRPVGSAA